jgi:hypothetical protein
MRGREEKPVVRVPVEKTAVLPVVEETPAHAQVHEPVVRVNEDEHVHEHEDVHANEHVRAKKPAHLSVASDVSANVFVDGNFVNEAPVEMEIAPGKHVVRVEGTANGIRLLPREQTVDLRAGESRRLAMELNQ